MVVSMSFEEKFPNLGQLAKKLSKEENKDNYLKTFLEAYCLDKQRVKEAIKKCTIYANTNNNGIDKRMLIKELGLEDE